MKDITKILEKYWEGETTLKEEKLIKEHYSFDKSSSHNNSKSLFEFFEQEKLIEYKSNISIPKKKKDGKLIQISFIKKIAIAASIFLVVGLGYIYTNNTPILRQNQFAKYEIKDPKKAREITEKALTMLAINYNKGELAVAQNINNLNKMNIFNKNIKNN